MKMNFGIWYLIMAVIVALLGTAFFEIAEIIIFRLTNIFIPEYLSQWIAVGAGITFYILGYKKAFKMQLEKVCRENFLFYRLNLNIFLLKFK